MNMLKCAKFRRDLGMDFTDSAGPVKLKRKYQTYWYAYMNMFGFA